MLYWDILECWTNLTTILSSISFRWSPLPILTMASSVSRFPAKSNSLTPSFSLRNLATQSAVSWPKPFHDRSSLWIATFSCVFVWTNLGIDAVMHLGIHCLSSRRRNKSKVTYKNKFATRWLPLIKMGGWLLNMNFYEKLLVLVVYDFDCQMLG